MCLGGGLGAVLAWSGDLFAESAGRFVCEVAQANVAPFTSLVGAACVELLGAVSSDLELVLGGDARVTLGEISTAFRGSR
jgi:hypothetical protein